MDHGWQRRPGGTARSASRSGMQRRACWARRGTVVGLCFTMDRQPLARGSAAQHTADTQTTYQTGEQQTAGSRQQRQAGRQACGVVQRRQGGRCECLLCLAPSLAVWMLGCVDTGGRSFDFVVAIPDPLVSGGCSGHLGFRLQTSPSSHPQHHQSSPPRCQ